RRGGAGAEGRLREGPPGWGRSPSPAVPLVDDAPGPLAPRRPTHRGPAVDLQQVLVVRDVHPAIWTNRSQPTVERTRSPGKRPVGAARVIGWRRRKFSGPVRVRGWSPRKARQS